MRPALPFGHFKSMFFFPHSSLKSVDYINNYKRKKMDKMILGFSL